VSGLVTTTAQDVLLVSAGMFVGSFSAVTYNVVQVSYRQSVTPLHLLGRMNASIRWVIWGSIPLGALLGGWLGSVATGKGQAHLIADRTPRSGTHPDRVAACSSAPIRPKLRLVG